MNMTNHTRLDLVEGGSIFKQGEHAELAFNPRDYSGKTVDLTGKDIAVAIWNSKGVMYEGAASFDSTAQLIRLTINQLLQHGDFQIEFTVTDAADPDYRRKFPSGEYEGKIYIKPSADNLDYVGVSMTTVAQFRKEFDQALNALPVDGEVNLSRIATDGTIHPNLPARLSAEQQATTRKLEEESQRLDNAIFSAGDGTVPAELTDIRVLNNKTYTTAGQAIRALAAGKALENQSVSYKKQRVVKFKESANLFNGNYSDLWVYTNGTKGLYRQAGLYSALVEIKPNAVLKLQTTGVHNRFIVAFLNDPNAATAEEVIHNDGLTAGNESFTVKNKDYKYMLVCVSNSGELPQLTVSELNEAISFEQEAETYSTPPDSKRYINPDTNAWSVLTVKVSVVRRILPGARIKIETVGTHPRFAVYTFNEFSNNPSTPTRIYPAGSDQSSQGNMTYEFVNGTANYMYIYLTTSAAAATPTVKITQSFDAYEGLSAPADTGNETPVVAYESTGIDKVKEVHPVMFGVKMSNERDKSRGYAETPRPVGWLYYHPESLKLFYANGEPENMKYLCDWNAAVTWNGVSKPEHYRPFITRGGDIIFVWRGDLLGLDPGLPNVRQNPIVYPAGNWQNPVSVDLGTGTKPTAWLQNAGADFLYNQNAFVFSEYTRPSHIDTHVWKVTKPFTNPANWRIVKSFPLSGNNQTGMKHCHTINYDPFSGLTYLTTGDDDDAAKVFSSSDYGETWNLELEGQRKYARVLNFVFTKDKVYWANDDSLHGFYSIDRDANSVPVFSNITELYDLTGNPPTYVNCLIDDPNGILILDRYDGATTNALKVHFWHIPTATMHVIKEIYPTENVAKTFGFRVEAANFYQAKGSSKIVTGFGNPKNDMALLGNTTYALNKDRINNLVLEVIPSGATFELKITTITDRT